MKDFLTIFKREFKDLLVSNNAIKSRLAEELGDLLFSIVNVSRLLKINAEFALRSATDKFTKRFTEVQNEIEGSGGSLDEADLSEMDRIWGIVKAKRRNFEKARELTFIEIQEELQYQFQDKNLLESAVCHKSFANENPDFAIENNERLEFLGDAVLDLILSRFLFERFPEAQEGDLTRWRSLLVNESRLAGIARSIRLGPALLLGAGEENSGGRDKNSILANATEALLAAVYLDGGFQSAQKVVERLFGRLIDSVVSAEGSDDYKSRLQELTQAKYKITPDYQLIESSGPDHDKTFLISVSLKDEKLAIGQGKSKKEAAQNAARKALQALKNTPETK